MGTLIWAITAGHHECSGSSTVPLPNLHALRHVWFSLLGGLVLPDEQQSGENGQGLGVDVQGPGALGEGGHAQLLEEGALTKGETWRFPHQQK